MSNAQSDQSDRKSPPEESAERHNSGSKGKTGSHATGINTSVDSRIDRFSSLFPHSLYVPTGSSYPLSWEPYKDNHGPAGDGPSPSNATQSTASDSWYKTFSRCSRSKVVHGSEAEESIVPNVSKKKE